MDKSKEEMIEAILEANRIQENRDNLRKRYKRMSRWFIFEIIVIVSIIYSTYAAWMFDHYVLFLILLGIFVIIMADTLEDNKVTLCVVIGVIMFWIFEICRFLIWAQWSLVWLFPAAAWCILIHLKILVTMKECKQAGFNFYKKDFDSKG